MKSLFALIAVTIILLAFFFYWRKPSEWNLNSPDGKIALRIKANSSTSLFKKQVNFSIWFDNGHKQKVRVLENSPLGISLENESFYDNLRYVGESVEFNVEEQYEMLSGKRKYCKNIYNQMIISFVNEKDTKIEYVFRVFNDGIGIKYRFPGNNISESQVVKEHTGFNLSPGHEIWSSLTKWPQLCGVKMDSLDENRYINQNWAFPFLVESKQSWVFICETGQDTVYPVSHLQLDTLEGIYNIGFSTSHKRIITNQSGTSVSSPFETPWRVIIFGETPANIIESTLVTDLSEPSRIVDNEWIKPGRVLNGFTAVGDCSGIEGQINTIELAASLGCKYVVLDVGCLQRNEAAIGQMVKYAGERGTGIFLCYRSGQTDSLSLCANDIVSDKMVRKEEFEKIKASGIKGVQIDFFQDSNINRLKLCFEILKDASDSRLLVIFRGCPIPLGWDRTWPNLMSSWLWCANGCNSQAENFFGGPSNCNTLLTLTKNALGTLKHPIEKPYGKNRMHEHSYAHVLARSVVFQSALHSFSCCLNTIQEKPAFVANFFKDMPVCWDETLYLQGRPGEYLIIARRKGNLWYFGGINSEETRDVSFKLPFIQKGKNVEIISDGDCRYSYSHRKWQFEGDDISIKMLPKGDLSVSINKIKI